MKAYSLHQIGVLKYEEVPYPECPSGWCIVKVKASGICSSDISRVFTKGTYHFPTIPGHEFSGVVVEVSDKENEYLLEKRVGVFPLIPCKKCTQCKNGQYEMCENYDYLGSRRNGGFAEYVAVPVWNLIEVGDEISFVIAAMMEPLAVSLHAIKQLSLDKTSDVAIVGTGMIAFAAAQWAWSKGASFVTIIGRSKTKETIAKTMGKINYITTDEIDHEYDVVLEAVGSNESIGTSIGIAKPGGKVVFMGNPEGDIVLKQDIFWRILRKQLIVKGTWNSSFENNSVCDWSEVRDGLIKGIIEVDQLVSHVFPQKNLKDGLNLMKEHKEPYCKIMTIWNEGENDE